MIRNNKFFFNTLYFFTNLTSQFAAFSRCPNCRWSSAHNNRHSGTLESRWCFWVWIVEVMAYFGYTHAGFVRGSRLKVPERTKSLSWIGSLSMVSSRSYEKSIVNLWVLDYPTMKWEPPKSVHTVTAGNGAKNKENAVKLEFKILKCIPISCLILTSISVRYCK